MPPKQEVEPEEMLRRKFHAKCLFRRLGRLVIENRYWLVEGIDEYQGVDDVKRRVEQAVRSKHVKKRLLNIMDKALLNKFAPERTIQEQQYLYRKLGNLKCFKRYPNNVRRKLAAVTYFKYYGPNRVIVRQHQPAATMYFIVEGDLAVSQKFYDELLREDVSVEVGTMTAGDMFGDVSLLHSTPRTATITTKGHCEMLALMKEDFKKVLQSCVQKQWDEVRRAMSAFTYFYGLDEMTRREGCIVAKMKSYAVNETMLGDGEGVPNFVYFILSGRCQMIESLQVAITTHLGRNHYKLHDPYIPKEESEESLEKKWFAGYRNKSRNTSTSVKSDTEVIEGEGTSTKLHGVLKNSRSQKRESSKLEWSQSIAQALIEAGTPRDMVKEYESHLLLSSSELHASSMRFSDQIIVSVPPISEQPQLKPPEIRTYFMQVVIFNPGSTFGFGENMRDRRIVALTPVECMLLPMVWLLQRNTANIWSRIRHFLDKKVHVRRRGSLHRASSTWKSPSCEEAMGVRQNPWTPTKRRGPIAAESASPGPAVVSLPSLIGKPPPESRKARAPAFTFGHKLDPPGFSGKTGPGPASYNTEGMTSKGRSVGPAASLHGRWPPPRVPPTPAPCDYEPLRAARAVLDHAPAFSIGLRVSMPQAQSKTPAPNIYSMPPVLGEAKEGSKQAAPAFSICGRPKNIESKTPMPGPGTYTTDKAVNVLTKRPPAYTMAPRRELRHPSEAIPGPGVYCPEKDTTRQQTKTYKHTFSSRSKIKNSDQVPAPNAYSPEKADRLLRAKSPAFSFRTKTEISVSHDAPAPNVYSPEKALNCLKSGPKYTLAGKGVAEKHDSTPAPNSYNPQKADKVLHESSPAYTMRSKDVVDKIEQTPAPNIYAPENSIHMLNGGPKFTMSGKGTNLKVSETPAPNSYKPEKADKVLHEHSPAYSFRIKEETVIRSESPAPNVYAPEKSMQMLNGTPKFTISGKGPVSKIENTPGPTAYCPDKADKLLHESSPAYTFRAKDGKRITDDVPAPNAYAPEKSMHMLDASPKFTIAGKGSTPKHDNIPAPNTYSPDKADKLLHDSSPAYTFRPKNVTERPNDTPAPNMYEPHLLDGTPKYSLYGKGPDGKYADTPGPNAYNPHLPDGTPKYTMAGKGHSGKPFDGPAPNLYDTHLPDNTPKYSLAGKGSDGKLSDTPGPNCYDPHLPSNSPKYTISGKGMDGKVSDTPGPNNYNPHLPSNSPMYTISGKGSDGKVSDTPGPNNYNPHLPSNSPMYTMSGKGPDGKVSDTPGPNNYNPHLASNSPMYTMSGKGPDGKVTDTPAPNNYDPHLPSNGPKYTICGKGPDGKVSNTPAPNAYDPNLSHNSPSFTMSGKGHDTKTSDVPAPNAYDPQILNGTPKFTMAPKGKPGKINNTPAPNAYHPEKADNLLMESSPAYSFTDKQPLHKPDDTPAPNSYDPSKYHYMLDGVPKYSFGIKGPAEKHDDVPAPNAYNPDKADKMLHETSPSYTFRPKVEAGKIVDTPGPAYYNPEKADKVLLDNAPRYSFRIKTNPHKADNVPAPNSYDPDKAAKLMKPSAPQYTFRIKSDALKIPDTPAPNVYTIPTPVKTPLYTISGRHKEPIDERLKVPAPGAYSPEKAGKFVLTYSPQYTFGVKIQTPKFAETPAPNTYRIPSVLDTPVYTISGRHKVPVDDRVRVPAPGTYSPEKLQLSRTPHITFGIKHSPLLGQLKPLQSLQDTSKSQNQQQASRTVEVKTTFVQNNYVNENDIQRTSNTIENVSNDKTSQNIVNESHEVNTYIQRTRTPVTQIRAETDIRSSTVTPEPVVETLTQEIVWVPEKPIRRNSYTIDKSDGSGFLEHYEHSDVVPVENGVRKIAASGERGASCNQETSEAVIKRSGFEQTMQKNVKNESAHEKSQTATEEVRQGTEVKHLANGGIAKTTTTTTVRKVGTAAKTAKATTTVTRTATAVTSRDVGAK